MCVCMCVCGVCGVCGVCVLVRVRVRVCVCVRACVTFKNGYKDSKCCQSYFVFDDLSGNAIQLSASSYAEFYGIRLASILTC